MASIREIDPERDAAGVVELVREADPYAVVTDDSWRHRAATVPAGAEPRGLVAEDHGRVVGTASALRAFWGSGDGVSVGVTVTRTMRRRGIGGALYETLAPHVERLGGGAVYVSFFESEDGMRFAAARGFQALRAEAVSVLDPRSVAEHAPAEVDVRPVRDVDPRTVYRLDLAATVDMPSAEPAAHYTYDEWWPHVLGYPLLTVDGSFVAFSDGEPAALSLLTVDGAGRASNMFTGSLPAFRGRGLAFAAKLASTRWAAAHGVTRISTHNDETNAPMLAINRRLGYRVVGRRLEWVRAETASSPARRAPAT